VPVLDSLDCGLAAALGGASGTAPHARQAPQSGLGPALERLLAAVP
jgi:hypothetical protein